MRMASFIPQLQFFACSTEFRVKSLSDFFFPIQQAPTIFFSIAVTHLEPCNKNATPWPLSRWWLTALGDPHRLAKNCNIICQRR